MATRVLDGLTLPLVAVGAATTAYILLSSTGGLLSLAAALRHPANAAAEAAAKEEAAASAAAETYATGLLAGRPGFAAGYDMTRIPPHDQVPAASMNPTPLNSDDFLALDLSSLSQHREKLTWTQEFFCMHSLTSNLLFCVNSAVSQRFQLQLAAGRGRGTAPRHSPLSSTSYGVQGVLGGGRC